MVEICCVGMCQCGVNLSFGMQHLCLPATTHLDHGMTQICIIMWPDFSETCLSVAVDPPLNENFYPAVEIYVSHYNREKRKEKAKGIAVMILKNKHKNKLDLQHKCTVFDV